MRGRSASSDRDCRLKRAVAISEQQIDLDAIINRQVNIAIAIKIGRSHGLQMLLHHEVSHIRLESAVSIAKQNVDIPVVQRKHHVQFAVVV